MFASELRSLGRGVLGCAAALGAAGIPYASGESAHARPRVARRISQPTLAFANPLGLAYSPRAHSFIVAPAEGPSRVQLLTHMEEPAGIDALDLAGGDALNMAFDGHSGRLLVFSRGQMLAVAADTGGRLRRQLAARFEAAHLGIRRPAGMTVDPHTGSLFILDSAVPRLVRLDPTSDGGLDAAAVSYIELYGIPADGVRGIAFNPSTEHVFLLAGTRTLYETNSMGELLLTHDISDAQLRKPGGMVFAPTGDQTDDPSAQSLYIADAASPRQGRPKASIVELTFAPIATAEAATTFGSSVVVTTLTSQWSPPAPDPSDVVYLPGSETLLVVDSEVEEMRIWNGANQWETTLGGLVLGTSNLTPPAGFTNEPTGISVNPGNGHLFYSDDGGKKVFEINPGPDGEYHTSDDIRTSFSTSAFGSTDPEDVTYHPGEGALYLADGVNAEVYRIAPGANAIFDGVPPAGDDGLTQFDVSTIVTDPEGLTVNTANGHLYIAGKPDTIVQEITTSGTLLQTINISAANPKKTAGLGYGPGSSDSTARRLYVVQRGVDNNSDPNENDGKLWEMTLPGGGPVNQPPIANAGPDQTITLPAPANLDGTVSDDGLPNPPGSVTTTWSKLSGPGTVTFGNASAVDTTASFSTAGTYMLRLTADDGALSTSDDVTMTVSDGSGQAPLSVINRGTIHSSTDAASYSFPSITASNNLLYVVFLNTAIGSGTAPSATSVSGAGLSFTEIGAPGGLLYSGTSSVRRIQTWRALSSAGATTGSIAINLSGTSIGMDAVLLEFSGMDTSGTNGSGAIAQSATNKATSATSLSVTLGAFGNSNNRPVAFFSHRVAEATTEEAGYTELDDASHSGPVTGAQCEWHATAAETTPSAAWLTAADAGGLALEVRSSSTSPPSNQPPLVNAGPDQTIALPASATLDGTVSDDGLPGSVTTSWSQLSGPGIVTFGNASGVDSAASFSTAGTYVLRLTADDGALSASDDVTVTVSDGSGQATLSVVKRDAIHTSADASSYAFAPVAASDDRLYIVFLSTSTTSAPAPSATDISGAGLSFSEIGTPGGVLYSGSVGLRRIQAWRALSSAGASTGSIAINLDGTSTGIDAVLLEFSGMDTSGTNGSGGIAQSATNTASRATSLTVTLATFGSPNNRPVAFFNHRVAEATTEEPGYTELDDGSHSAPTAGAACEWHAATADTTPSASWLTAANVGGFAVEVKAAGSP